ncbi:MULTISPECIES: hypothetical protein [Streptomyces]|uniref:SUKH-4 immunity protein n=1 Tax=Streptomyces koelreuteriae TaxID=2838015 RepID=A0ABX8FQD1_9ACTN|nr:MULTISPECIES: hypothetical protein [Streptomyces]QWB23332.1 hypothetical protein KJK29_12355 [Streptomyces koelreuteriae]UUA06284.1 hypothetical protein NNW98_12410 [Streptomyces koelreuteriae]UUA13911.1 hypothetical protein NNW99_12410 [Streptomyces sp. CRCS-T-1]
MIYDLLLVGPPVSPMSLAEALAGAVRPEGADVDVADRDGDQSQRDWTAPVLCGYSRLRGDLSLALDIYVEDALVNEAPPEPELARRLAAALGVPVLYPAEVDLPPSAYWLATSSGQSVRARLLSSDDEPPVHVIDAVEAKVPGLPRATVEILPEILERDPIPTPVSDTALATLPPGTAASAEGHVHYYLRVWERLTHALEGLIPEPGEPHADPLRDAVTRLDRTFGEHTVPDPTQDNAEAAPWWQNRVPRHIPW